MQGIRVEKRLIIRSGEIYLEKDGLKFLCKNTSQKVENLMCKQKYICESINSYARNAEKKFYVIFKLYTEIYENTSTNVMFFLIYIFMKYSNSVHKRFINCGT